uniref:FAD dependent oxidoreductase domain-containing protein n=1 Tax=Timema bartmani TaxID=61472 RepID=A0A7R9F002_9NEOP|nr:unnamed protein product [Timema bartmani]
MGSMQIGILGAGVVGLNTALELQRQFPTARLTIIADKFNGETTSDGAAGIFRPSTSFSGPTENITKFVKPHLSFNTETTATGNSSEWIQRSYDYYNELYLSEQASLAGVNRVSGHIVSSISPEIVREKLSSLLKMFQQDSGHIIKRRINSFQELVGDFDIVVNCTGLGAKYLCSDYKLVPIRGQVLKVRAPWLKTFLYADFDTYIVPGSLATTIGGCRQYESYDLDVSPHDSAAIKERAFRLIPGLKRAPVIREWVGLRPHRSIVRVETEIINTTSGKLKVVHNYGHGGYGVMTAPGTAQHAVQLVKGLHLAGLGNSKL